MLLMMITIIMMIMAMMMMSYQDLELCQMDGIRTGQAQPQVPLLGAPVPPYFSSTVDAADDDDGAGDGDGGGGGSDGEGEADSDRQAVLF